MNFGPLTGEGVDVKWHIYGDEDLAKASDKS